MGRAFEYRKAAKEKRWASMSRVFPKLAKIITVVVKQGGPDPDSNSALRTAILNAKAQNMPKANIDAAIKRASGKDAIDLVETTYEGRGPHGVLLFVEAATDNGTRTVANVKAIFSKNGGQVVPNGSLEFMFDRKAVFEFEKNADTDLEALELELIDAGLEEMEVEENTVLLIGDYKDFGTLNAKLEELKVDLIKAELQRLPNNPQTFTDEQMVDIDKLIEKLEDDEDVQVVFTNIA